MEDKCLICKNYNNINEEGKCDIYDIPNHMVSDCPDWREK